MQLKTVNFGFANKNMSELEKEQASKFLTNKGFNILRISKFGISARVPQNEVASLMQSLPKNDQFDGEKSSFFSFPLTEDFHQYFNKGEIVLRDLSILQSVKSKPSI